MAKNFEIEVVTINKNETGPDAIAPSVYLNDKLLAGVGAIRDGKITEQELIDELTRDEVPRRQQ